MIRDTHGLPPEGGAETSWTAPTVEDGQAKDNPIGAMLVRVIRLLAYEDPTARPFAEYFRMAGLTLSGGGPLRRWSLDIYSSPTAARIRSGALTNGQSFDEWGMVVW
jgi:hypothetical protein